MKKRLIITLLILIASFYVYADGIEFTKTSGTPTIPGGSIDATLINLGDTYPWTGLNTYGNNLVLKDGSTGDMATVWGVNDKITGYDGSYYAPTGIQLWFASPTATPTGQFDWVDMSGSANVGVTGKFVYTTRGYNDASTGAGNMTGVWEEMDDYGSGTYTGGDAHSITYYNVNTGGGSGAVSALNVQYNHVSGAAATTGSVAALSLGTDVNTDNTVNTIYGINQYNEIEGNSTVAESHNLKLFFANDSTTNTVGLAELISLSINSANMDQVTNLYGIHFGDFGGCGTTCAALLVDDQTGTSYALKTGTGRVHLGGTFDITPVASPPSSPVEGQIYFDTSHAACYYDGSTWQKLAGAGTCA